MKDLPPKLRSYLLLLYTSCAAMTLIAALRLATDTLPTVLTTAVIFVVLAYAGERTRLQVSGSNAQTLATAVHICIILLFPPEVAIGIALLAAVGSQVLHGRSAWYKRLFNICHPTLATGFTSMVIAVFHPLMPIPHAQKMLNDVPIIAFIMIVYYLIDMGTMLFVLSFSQDRGLFSIWKEAYQRTLLPELAMSTIGILASVAWQFDHLLIMLFVLPVIVLGIAFRAIATEDRAQALRRRSEQLEAVVTAGRYLRLQHSHRELLQAVVQAARTIVSVERVEAYMYSPHDRTVMRRVASDPPLPEDDASEQDQPATEGSSAQTLTMPFNLETRGTVGFLRLWGVDDQLPSADRDTLTILVMQATIALENALLHENAVRQASTDGLTGLSNHRTFQQQLQDEVTYSLKRNVPLSLIMVDLDDFGSINNQFGHPVGDSALKAIAQILLDATNESGFAARYGGDEFALILPRMAFAQALALAENLCIEICHCTLQEGVETLTLSASIGVAEIITHGHTREELIQAADQAAYAAKHAGKGQVGRPEDALLLLEPDPERLSQQLAHANLATVEALASAVDAKDPYTYGHSERVSAYAVAIAEAMNLSASDIKRIQMAGLLHDVGKIGIPDAILAKASALEHDEFAIVKQHPEIGERMLRNIPFLADILPAVRHHHERWDGLGYPDRLKEEAVPSDAAILCVADALDAMTTSRPYRAAMSSAEALQRIHEGMGTQFAPHVVRALQRAVFEEILVLPKISTVEDLSLAS